MAFGSSSVTLPDYEVPVPINDSIQTLSWSPTSNLLVDGGWDNNVRCWEIQKQGTQFNAVPKAQISHNDAVLCTSFSADGSTVFSGSVDKTAKMWQLGANNQGQQIAAHDQAISGIAFIRDMNCVVTGSWDRTLKYWDTRAPTAQATIQLPERCYGLSVNFPVLVAITADRKECVVDLKGAPQNIFRVKDSTLKYQLRTVAVYPDAKGYAVGSIEGRVSLNSIQDPPANSQDNFAFKCHRQDKNVYPIHSIHFNRLGTFATAGGDGEYRFWDKDQRQRLYTGPRSNMPITAGQFNASGDIYAYAVSYDWCKGSEHYNPNAKGGIKLHNVLESEIQKKKK